MAQTPDLIVDGLVFEVQAVGGISQIFRECLPRMCNLGAHVTICTTSSVQQPIPTHAGLTHVQVGSYGRLARPEGRTIRFAGPFRRTLLASHLRGRFGSIWQSTYFTLPPRRWSGPHAVFVSDLIYELFPDLLGSAGDVAFRKQQRRCIAAADVLICNSETTKNDLLNAFDLPGVPVHVVHLAAGDVYTSDPAPHEDNRTATFFLYVGARNSYKNFRLVVEAWSSWSRRTEVSLVVAGPPFSKQETRMIGEAGIGGSVRHVGRPTDRELAALYRAAAGFIYPSLYEGFGIPLLEAMGCGCPVIASDIPSSREVAGSCARYFDPLSPTALTAALDAVLDSPRGGRVACGLQRAREFSWDKTSQALHGIYSSL